MIKRPVTHQLTGAVLAGRKTTTIRDRAWPIGKPIMLYNWSGAPYRSKHIDVAVIVVKSTREIKITHRPDGGMIFAYGQLGAALLHETEGFKTRRELESWFRCLVRPGQTCIKQLMEFELMNAELCGGSEPSASASGSQSDFTKD